jgi:hypothetical protein
VKRGITDAVRHCLVLIFSLLVLCQSALAQPEPPPPPPSPAAATTNIQSISIITSMVSSIVSTGFALKFINAGKTMASKFTQGALVIAGALALMTITWELTINMKDGKPLLEGVVETMMFCAIVMFLMFRGEFRSLKSLASSRRLTWAYRCRQRAIRSELWSSQRRWSLCT